MHTDPISDMLTRIRNAQLVKKAEVVLPYSKLKLAVLKVLERENWVKEVSIIKPDLKIKKSKESGIKFEQLKLGLIYDADGEGKIKSIQRVSKPGKRVYAAKDKLPKVLNGWGMAIISTSQGLMTDNEARKKGLGGEVVCEIY
ncbi:MAG: 30S ribosomal protein S8 [Patescibacteria group bacterium]|nr:30S ribosomal protein S8 [Patescibacteria group bacterium]